jgi:hypothetical protein
MRRISIPLHLRRRPARVEGRATSRNVADAGQRKGQQSAIRHRRPASLNQPVLLRRLQSLIVSAIPTRTLPALLERLETALIEHGLAQLEDFRPGLDAKTIRERTAALPVAFLGELRELYEWHDGMRRGELLPGLTFKSLDAAVRQSETAIEQLARGLGPWELDWFPVFDSESCTHFVRCGAVEHGGLWYSCPEFSELGWLADSLYDWVEWCAQVYEEGAIVLDTKMGRSIDVAKSAAILRDLDTVRPDVKSLMDALTGDDEVRHAKARDRLIAYNYPEAVEPVLELLCAERHDVVVDAARILASSGRRDTIAPMIKVAAGWERAAKLDNPVLYELSRYGPDTVSLLTDSLSANDEELRAAAATCIGAFGDACAYPALHAALSDSSARVRSAAGEAMVRLQRK